VTYVFLVALVLIMIGELADKSQLLALLLACRYKAWQVLIGIFIATFVVHFFTTLLGMLAGAAIPAWIMPWVSGVLFVGFGIWTLRGDTVSEEETERGGAAKYGPIIATTVAFFFAELGDKTQFMTLAIAADPGGALIEGFRNFGPQLRAVADTIAGGVRDIAPLPKFWAITLGSTIGMVLADAIAIGVGRLLGKNLPEKLLTRVSGTIFIVFGVLTVVGQYL
jgi:putative Ca2+/H+ antiporter (TMEM165/GDT1 family)